MILEGDRVLGSYLTHHLFSQQILLNLYLYPNIFVFKKCTLIDCTIVTTSTLVISKHKCLKIKILLF